MPTTKRPRSTPTPAAASPRKAARHAPRKAAAKPARPPASSTGSAAPVPPIVAPPLSARHLARGEAVVTEVLEATLEELALVGYRALRVDAIAKAAGVNKTTVYRRWPTKADLVKAALSCATEPEDTPQPTGTLRGDLVQLGLGFARFVLSVRGQSIVRVMFTERSDPEMNSIVQAVRTNRLGGRIAAIIQAARARRDPGSASFEELHVQMLFAMLHHRAFFLVEPIDEVWVRRVVDVILHGAVGCPEKGHLRR